MNKQLTTALMLCLFGLAILSNRSLMLRQVTVGLSHNASLRLPVDSTSRSQAGGRTLLLAVPNEETADAPQLERNAIVTSTDSSSVLRDSRNILKFQADPPSRTPSYIVQSVLNL
jgi:hypothetical protein